MNLYEFITPSDPVTFLAKDDKIAFVCAVLLGNGQAGCQKENGERLNTMLFLDKNYEKTISNYLEESLNSFIANKNQAINEIRGMLERRRHDKGNDNI